MCIYNGEDYRSDVARVINKFDIYWCDLGEPDKPQDSINKWRPCVIVSSNNINTPKNMRYLVAPIRTEHKEAVTEETLENFLKFKASRGRYYVPLLYGSEDLRFIDVSQIISVSNSKIKEYKCTVINEVTRKNINNALAFMQFTKDEYSKIQLGFVELPKPIAKNNETENQDKQSIDNSNPFSTAILPIKIGDESKQLIAPNPFETPKFEDLVSLDDNPVFFHNEKPNSSGSKRPTGKFAKIDNFPDLYEKWKNGELSINKISEITGKAYNTVYNHLHNYDKYYTNKSEIVNKY